MKKFTNYVMLMFLFVNMAYSQKLQNNNFIDYSIPKLDKKISSIKLNQGTLGQKSSFRNSQLNINCVDTNAYVFAKMTNYSYLIVTKDDVNRSTGFGQKYYLSDSIIIHGFDFYAQAMDTSKTVALACNLYSVDSLPVALLATDTVDVKNFGRYMAVFKDIDVSKDFAITVLELNKDSAVIFTTASSDGQNEGLSMEYYFGEWYDLRTYYGASGNRDFLFRPIITVDVNSNFSYTTTGDCIGDTVKITNLSKVNTDIHFNYGALAGIPIHNWYFNADTSTKTNPSFEFQYPGNHQLRNYSIFYGYSNTCIDSLRKDITSGGTYSETWSDAACAGNDGSATVSITMGIGPFTFKWNDPGNQVTPTASNLTSGLYTITITDSIGCIDIDSINVPGGLNPLGLSVLSWDVSCNNGLDGSAEVSVFGGIPSYFYQWNDPKNQDSSYAWGLKSGVYWVDVWDSIGCYLTDSVYIDEPSKLEIVVTDQVDATCGVADGSVTVSAYGGISPYMFYWSNGTTTANNSSLSAGVYTSSVIDANGCTRTKITAINNQGAPAIDILEAMPISCFGESDGALRASVSGGKAPYTYLWYDLLGDTLSAADYIDSLLDDTYIVEVLDSVGCKSIKSYNIKEPDMLNIWLTTGDVKCNGDLNGWAVATAYGGTSPYWYSWSTGDTTNLIYSLYAGYYVVDVYDTNGCWAMDTAWINQPDELMIYTDATPSSCGNNDGSAWASAAGGSAPYWYSWTTGDITQSVDSLFSGIYTVTVMDDSGCWEWDIVAVVDSNGPQVVAKDSLGTMCNGGSDGEAWVSVSGGTTPYTYLWTNILTGDTASMDDASTGLMMGWYVVSIWDSNGCKSLDGVYIDEPEIMQILTDSWDASCAGYNDGSAIVSAWGESGMYNYEWSTGDTTSWIDSLVAGGYAVTVIDANGCGGELTDSIYIWEPEMLEVWTDGWDVTCNAYADGAVWASAAGGTSPYWYSWSNNDNGEWVDSILAGTYVVTVYDDNDCWTMDTVMVDDSMALSLVITGTNVTCNGNNDGEAFVIASSGNVPYYYLWSTSIDTTSKISGLDAGTYAVTVMDDSGCVEIASVTLSEPLVLSVSTSTTFDSTVQKGTATAVALGGIVPYSYKWSDGSTTATATGLPEGTYTVTVTDANGCVVADTAKVVGKPGSINELSKSAFVSLYPNPTNGSISIEIHSGKSQILEIGIYNVLGAKVGSIESSKSSKYKFHADLTTLNDGIYFVRVKTADSSYVTKVTLNK